MGAATQIGIAAALTSALSFAAIACAGESPPAQAAPAGLAIGDQAPLATVKLANVDGKSITLAEVRGKKGTLVVFTCNHCPWAQAWEGRIIELGNLYSKKGFGVVAINSNDPEAYPEDAFAVMKDRAKERGMAFPYVVDATSDLARAFGATHTPEAYLFDNEGKLVYHGGVDDNAKHPDQVTARWLRDALEAVATGKQIAVAETKAMGCSIKLRSKGGTSSS
jgi:peroxiredoxin